MGTTSEKAASPTSGIEDVEDLLGGVGARREVVRGEDGQRGRLAEPLVLDLVAVQRRAEDLALEPVGEAVRRERHREARGRRRREVGSGGRRSGGPRPERAPGRR